jgi:hypothetical protein
MRSRSARTDVFIGTAAKALERARDRRVHTGPQAKTARGAKPFERCCMRETHSSARTADWPFEIDARNEGETAARTVCLLARRRLEEALADVVPIRRKYSSKVDYCNCPRHMPHLWNWLNFSCCIEDASISEFGAT